MRTREAFKDGWRFHKGDITVNTPKDKGPLYVQAKTERFRMGPASVYYSDKPESFEQGNCFPSEKWEYVILPHDYVVGGTPDPNENNALGYLPYENAWYRRHFTIPEEDAGKRLILQFDGVGGNATVYLNGCLIKRNFSRYNSFDADITDFANIGGENLLAVYVNCEEHESWWYEGSGIYRQVWLLKTDEIAVDTDGVYVCPKRGDNDRWDIEIETTVVSIASATERVRLVTEIVDREGNVVAVGEGETEVSSHYKATARYSAAVSAPRLWDIDDPYLYSVRTKVIRGEEICDEYTTRTGFRYFSCDPEKGFFLNGRRVVIKGVCGHEDCGLLGKAVPDNVHKYRMSLLKEMGANGYRTSHYQQHNAILDAADELGLIVLNEARWFSSSEESIEQLETLVRRDRNRPSVFFWSLSNEEYYHLNEQGRRITKTLMETLRRLDPCRPITSAIDKSPDKATVCDELDIIGINYNLNLFDEVHSRYPDKAVFSSENSASTTTRGWYEPNCTERGYLTAYDNDVNLWFRSREYTWKYLSERPWVMGGYQWSGFEYRGETTWPRLCSQSGAIDFFLQKKDAFYQNLSFWSDSPMVHLLPHWNVESYGEHVEVWCYTNCEEVELFLNQKSLGRVKCERFGHAKWLVDYEAGRLEAVGYNSGEEAARDVKETAGAPKELHLRLENKFETTDDIGIFTCYVTDSDGRVVPNACPTVEFHTNGFGRIIGTGSDVCDHVPVTSPIRRMREGYISVAVGFSSLKGVLTANSGELELYAKAEGLKGAKIKLWIGNREQ